MHLNCQLNSPIRRCGQYGCGLHRGWLRTWAWAMLVMLALACGTPAQAAEAEKTAIPADAADTANANTDAAGTAAATAPPATPTDTPPETNLPVPAAPGLRFKVAVDAPEHLQALLLRHLNIQRFHDLPDLDLAELRRLANQVPTDVFSLLGTQGYFSPMVQTRLQAPAAQGDGPAQPPATAQSAGVWTVHITVQPGPVSVVGNVLVAFTDEADTTRSPDLPQLTARERVRSQWPLTTGAPFSQAAWDSAKTNALRTLSTDTFPNARLVGSLADVDTVTHSVNLAVELDTGPAFQLGPIQIEGLKLTDPRWIENMVRVGGAVPGQPYRLQDLQTAQQRLAQSGYFESVFVYVDPDSPPQAAPIRVQVREARRGRLLLGVGASTDNGHRLSAEHVWNRVPGLDMRALSKLTLERDHQNIETEWRSPLDLKGWQWLTRLQAERTDASLSSITSQQMKLGKVQETEHLNRGYFVQYDRALTDSLLLRQAGPLEANESISVNYAWSRRQFDTMPLPSRGHGLAAEVGMGTTLGSVRQPYVRSKVRWQGLLPLDGLRQWLPDPSAAPELPASPAASSASQSRLGRLAMRAEGGAIVSRQQAPVPDSQRFWAGGDQSVRGYGLNEVGVTQTDGSVRPGRLMAAGSLEWQRPVFSNGQPTAWETTVFVDAGAVADQVSTLKARVGVGAGMRFNSPAGPLQFDLAYGLTPRKFRLHMSVGFAF